MRIMKFLIASAGAILMFWGCDTKDPIHETEHPEQGRITIATDWSQIGNGITKPTSWTAVYGSETQTVTTDTYTFPNLLEPGDYSVFFYNTADHIIVSGTIATANYSTGTPGWFFTGKLDAEVKKDTDHEFAVVMAQQVRQLTLVVDPIGGEADNIAGITGTLSGVAGTLDIDSDAHGAASDVALNFTKITVGTDAGKWAATIRLLGIAGPEQKLTGTIRFNGGNPADQRLESDLTAVLTNFNADKKTPLTLGGTVSETPTEAGIAGTINGWVDQSSITGDVEEQ